MKNTVILGVTGGIAAIKSLELLNKLLLERINLEVIITPAAEELIDKLKIEKKINKKVYTSLFAKKIDVVKILKERQVEHIALADKASAIVVAPATANIIAKLANGITDDYLTTVVLAATCPVIICPSMNVHMWHHPITQKNIQTLRSLGYIIVEPDSGLLACGYEGQGRLAGLDIITDEVIKQLKKSENLKGKKIIVTAGGTKELIDDVRFITNRSSGKMGANIAEALYFRGADVLLIRSKTALIPRYNIPEKLFETADDLEKILQQDGMDADYIFHAAAVSDFTIEKQMGKVSSNSAQTMLLHPREKIITKIKKWNPKIKLIAFKAEANSSEKELINKSREKLLETNADFVVANDISKRDRGFEVDTNEVIVISKTKTIKIPMTAKSEIANKVIDLVFKV